MVRTWEDLTASDLYSFKCEHEMIRKAVYDDSLAIARVHISSWQVAYRGQMPDEVLDGLSLDARTSRWQKVLSSAVHPGEVWVADHDEEVMGFISVGPSRDPDADGLDIGEIYAIYVVDTYWGRGYGRRLLEEGLASLKAQGLVQVTLWVLDSNKRARDFYEQHGFVVDGKTRIEETGQEILQEVRYRLNAER